MDEKVPKDIKQIGSLNRVKIYSRIKLLVFIGINTSSNENCFKIVE